MANLDDRVKIHLHWHYGWEQSGLNPLQISKALADWDERRRKRDYTDADEIRDRMAERGIVFESFPKGSRWRMDLFELHRRKGTLPGFFGK